MLRTIILLGLVSSAAIAAPALAQSPARTPAAASIDGRAVVADVRRILAANYVLPEARPKLDAVLAKGLASGRYAVSDPGELAERINADLTSVAHDKHLGMHYDPKEQAELAARPAGAGADDAPPGPEDIRQAAQFNHGITELKVLPGNIRYMNYQGFMWAGPKTAEALDNAMRFLRDGDAVIIDLRQNGGGSPDAVQYLVSHFLDPNRKIVTFYMRGDPASPLASLTSLPAGRMVGKPLYVLTSGMTASAAEEFTGHVDGFKLGEVIGETTAGAGYRNEFFPVAGGYVISVSVGRAVLASTGKDWEGVGIAPAVKVDQTKALDVAEAHALRRIAQSAPGEEKVRLEARAAVLDARVNPVTTALPLETYAGVYGERTVALDGDRLTWQFGHNPKSTMIPIGPNEFSFNEDPMSRIRFTVAGNIVTGVQLIRGDGSKVDAQRTR